MKIKKLIAKNRSRRRFYQGTRVNTSLLKELIDLARLSPSAGNLQPLKYMLSSDAEKNRLVFSCLSWAGYLKDWDGPIEGERPSAYIIVLGDTTIAKNFSHDAGIASQSILLGAVEKGLAGCIIGMLDRERLRTALKIPAQYEISIVIPLGKPKEKVRLEKITKTGDIKYWRSQNGIHHVPKRSLEEIIL